MAVEVRLGVFIAWIAKKAGSFPIFNDVALVHKGSLIAGTFGLLHIVGHQ